MSYVKEILFFALSYLGRESFKKLFRLQMNQLLILYEEIAHKRDKL